MLGITLTNTSKLSGIKELLMVERKRKFTDDELKSAIEANPTMSNRKLGELFFVNEKTIRVRKSRLAQKGWSPQHDMVHEVPDGYKIKGISTYYDQYGKPKAQWVKSTQDGERHIELLKEAVQGYIDELPKYPPITIYNEHEVNEELMAVLPIGDLHVGMMAWKDECGEDWSLAHVEAAVQLAFKDIVDKCPPCDTGVLINLGDFAHRDTREAVTPLHRHQLDVDSRYPKMVRTCIRLKRFLLELMLTKFKNVIDINVSGNHDPCLSVVLSECLTNVYEKEPRVTIDNKPKPMHYVEFGNVMIVTTHGDTIKMEKVPGVAATDEAAMWGRTKYRYGLTGHIHSENKKEFPGMVVESFRTLAAADSFASWYGWRSGRDTRAIIYHKKHGKQYEIITGITMYQEILDNI